MAESWEAAKEIAAEQKLELVYHDYDTGEYGAAEKDDLPGHFKVGAWIPHRVFAASATAGVEKIEEQEKEFLEEHPDWVEGSSSPAGEGTQPAPPYQLQVRITG